MVISYVLTQLELILINFKIIILGHLTAMIKLDLYLQADMIILKDTLSF